MKILELLLLVISGIGNLILAQSYFLVDPINDVYGIEALTLIAYQFVLVGIGFPILIFLFISSNSISKLFVYLMILSSIFNFLIIMIVSIALTGNGVLIVPAILEFVPVLIIYFNLSKVGNKQKTVG